MKQRAVQLERKIPKKFPDLEPRDPRTVALEVTAAVVTTTVTVTVKVTVTVTTIAIAQMASLQTL